MKLLILILLSFNSYSFDHTHQKWQKTLDDHLKRNEKQTFFNYGQLKKDNTNFEEYLKSLSSVKLEEYKKFNDNQKLAFLINAYNAFTVKLIIKNYPGKSIKDIGSICTN